MTNLGWPLGARPGSRWLTLALLAMLGLAGCAVPQTPPAAPPPPPPPAEAPPPEPPAAPAVRSDQDFINQAIGLGQTEIGMGRLAEGKGAARPMRLLAMRMVAGHRAMNHRLTLLAKHLKLEIAPPPDEPPPGLLTTIGPDFDRHYLGLAVAGHQNLIALYESEASSGQDPRLIHYARGALPLLRHQLHEVETIAGKLGA
jgi:putative membrane protein